MSRKSGLLLLVLGCCAVSLAVGVPTVLDADTAPGDETSIMSSTPVQTGSGVEEKKEPTEHAQPSEVIDPVRLQIERQVEAEEALRAQQPAPPPPPGEQDAVWFTKEIGYIDETGRDMALGAYFKGPTDDSVRVISVSSTTPYPIVALVDTALAAPGLEFRTDVLENSAYMNYGCAVGDIHPDGYTDIVYGRYSSSYALRKISWVGGAWVAADIFTASASIYDIAIGDADNDAVADDIIYAGGTSSYGAGRCYWGGSSWVNAPIYSGSYTVYGVAIGDCDPTLAGNEVYLSCYGRTVVKLWWNGTSFTPTVYTVGATTSISFYDIAIGNFDQTNGAQAEIALYNGYTPYNYGAVHELYYNGGWLNRILYTSVSSPTWSTYGEIAVGDFIDANSCDEIVAVSGGGTQYNARAIYSTNGGTSWLNEQVGYAGGTCYGVAVGNVNKWRSHNQEVAFSGSSATFFEAEQVDIYNDDMRLATATAPTMGILAAGATFSFAGTAQNVGKNSRAPGVPVKMAITGPGGYSFLDVDQATATTLVSGATEVVTFAPTWTAPNVLGSYLVKIWTELSGDENQANDTFFQRVYVCDLYESFTATDFPPMLWSAFDFDGYTGSSYANWHRYTSSYYTSPGCARVRYATSSIRNDDWLVTPRLVITANDSLFFYARGYSTSYYDTCRVKVSTDPDPSNRAAYVEIDKFLTNPSTYEKKGYDLSAYAGDTVYVAFHYNDLYEYYLYVDDVYGPKVLRYDDEMQASQALVPANVALRASLLPVALAAEIKNNAQSPENNFAVRCTVYDAGGSAVFNDEYMVTTPVPAYTTDTVSFASWTPAAPGSYTVAVRTVLAGDQVPGNDRAAATVVVHQAFPTGGPDEEWYFWADSDAPGGPTYSWVDITTTGTDVPFPSYDDAEADIPVGFTFKYYGTDYTQLRVATNGVLSFDPGADIDYTNDTIPTDVDPLENNMIAMLWDDLSCIGAGRVKYQTLGTTPNCPLVVSYDDIRYLGSDGDSLTFQVLLFESTNDILIQYQNPFTADALQGQGQSATIGIENADGTSGLCYLFNAKPYGNMLASSRAIRFYRFQPSTDASVAAVVVPGALVAPGSEVYPELTVTNAGLVPISDVPVYIEIRKGASVEYSASGTVAALDPGETANLTMTTPWTVATEYGIDYEVTAWTLLSGDEWPANDTLATGVLAHAQNTYYEFLWTWPSTRTDAGLYGCTNVQDTLVWASCGFLDPWQMYILDYRTRAVVDSFTQYGTEGSYGYRDLTYDPVLNVVFAGLESNRLDKINANPPYNLIATYTVSGANLPSVVRGLTLTDDDSLYCSNWGDYGLLKMAKDGSNCHRVSAAELDGSPYGLGNMPLQKRLYGSSGDYTGDAYQWGFPPVVYLGSMIPPGLEGVLQSGCEVYSDSFLLIGDQDLPGVHCYRIIPKPSDIVVSEITAPVGVYDTNAIVSPAAVLRNAWTEAKTFTAWFLIDDPTDGRVYTESQELTLLPGESRSVIFNSMNSGYVTGDWTAKCSTYVVGDQNPDDNILDGPFKVVAKTPWAEGWSVVRKPVPGTMLLKDGAWMAPAEPEDGKKYFYVVKGNKSTEFYRYSAADDSWEVRASIDPIEEGRTKPPKKGCAGVSDGSSYIYMAKGNNTFGFWRYDIAKDSWKRMPNVPEGPDGKKVKAGTDLAYHLADNDTGWVYLLKGGRTEFYKFNVETQTWSTCDNAPYGVKPKYDYGSFLTTDNGKMYAHQAKWNDGTKHYMFRYDLDRDTWDLARKGMPLIGADGRRKKVKDGASGAWYDGEMYTFKGGNTQYWFKYNALGDTWTELETIPRVGLVDKRKKVKGGADVAAYENGVFFALKGNKVNELWRYVIPYSVSGTRPERSGVMGDNFDIRAAKLEVFPNPIAGGFATVRYSLPKAGPVTVNVFDVAGRSVQRQTLVATRAGATSIDLRKLANGVYLVRFETEGFSQNQKLVVQR